MPEDAQTVVLRVGMHCDACKRKVCNAVGCLSGVYEVTPDLRTQKVIVKGNFDSNEVLKAVRKTGKSAAILELVPIEQKPQEPPKEPSEPPKPPDPPKIVIVTLKVMMHCEHCKRKVERALRALSGC
ncbi:hypothetical protein O6H91_04G137200 [Diphasiastrum complanatum]|uniref:Uncharacterized protein n=1 Tax=Diphasiastrum complanatum TaxID=34168 RepID=A0ACC2E2M1_DIPCM|nr:hypothetical protein O6H91_04G137200 [Diphasiastrum complanatum]